MNCEDITHTALSLLEHIFEFPKSPFAVNANHQREQHGSIQFRTDLHYFAVKIEEAATTAWKKNPDLMEILHDSVGCWDFEVIPQIADHFASSWDSVSVETITAYLLECGKVAEKEESPDA